MPKHLAFSRINKAFHITQKTQHIKKEDKDKIEAMLYSMADKFLDAIDVFNWLKPTQKNTENVEKSTFSALQTDAANRNHVTDS